MASDEVWGVAYRIMESKVDEVRSYLDIREIDGYSIHQTPFHPADASLPSIHTTVYIGTPDNPQFMGPQDPQKLAEHISTSRGPSGENKEYLFIMEQCLNELCPESGDEHVQDLARRVRLLDTASGSVSDGEVAPASLSYLQAPERRKDEGQEEVEKA